MDLIFSIISAIFIGLLVLAAFTIGLSLLLWGIGFAALVWLYVWLRAAWWRWRFTRESDARSTSTHTVIDAEFEEVRNPKS